MLAFKYTLYFEIGMPYAHSALIFIVFLIERWTCGNKKSLVINMLLEQKKKTIT